MTIAKGQELPQTKLTETQVRRIRREYREMQRQIIEMRKEFSVEAYAEHYGVSTSAMEKVLQGKTWAWVSP